jgi:hypothetical protein
MTGIRPSADEGFWLYEYQKTLVNVRGLISRGQSESATRIIDEQIARWQRGCQITTAGTPVPATEGGEAWR